MFCLLNSDLGLSKISCIDDCHHHEPLQYISNSGLVSICPSQPKVLRCPCMQLYWARSRASSTLEIMCLHASAYNLSIKLQYGISVPVQNTVYNSRPRVSYHEMFFERHHYKLVLRDINDEPQRPEL